MDPIIVRVPPKVTQMLEIQVLFPNPSKQQMTSTNCENNWKERMFQSICRLNIILTKKQGSIDNWRVIALNNVIYNDLDPRYHYNRQCLRCFWKHDEWCKMWSKPLCPSLGPYCGRWIGDNHHHEVRLYVERIFRRVGCSFSSLFVPNVN